MKDNLDHARKYLADKKIDDYEIFYLENSHLFADAKLGKIESFEEAKTSCLAIRVIKKNRLGFSYTTSLEPKYITDCVDWAIQASAQVEPDDAWSFSGPGSYSPFLWKHLDSRLPKISVSKKVALALQLETAAKRADSRIKRVRHSSFEETETELKLVNSKGIDVSYKRCVVGCDIVAVATAGNESQWASDFGFSYSLDGLDIEKIGARAARRAVALLGAKSVKTTKVAACLHPYVAAQFLGILGRGFYGDNIYKKKSFLAGKMGKKVYSKKLNLIDDALMEGGYCSMPFDAEGHSTKTTQLIEDGGIKNWLTDTFWGKKLGTPSTGSSVRSNVKGLPGISASNLYIKPGEVSEEDLISSMETGFYITNVAGAHTVNPITGEFSVGAEGQWVSGGRIIHPVKGVLIAGNLHNIFANIDEVGDDLLFLGGVGSPALKISEIQISGT